MYKKNLLRHRGKKVQAVQRILDISSGACGEASREVGEMRPGQ